MSCGLLDVDAHDAHLASESSGSQADLVKTFFGGGAISSGISGALGGLTGGSAHSNLGGGASVDPFDLSGYGTLSF